jgi:hypothetical protein
MTASRSIIHHTQLAQVGGQVVRGAQGVGVVFAQYPAAAVQGVLVQVPGRLHLTQLAQACSRPGRSVRSSTSRNRYTAACTRCAGQTRPGSNSSTRSGFAYTNLHELHCGNRDYAKADSYFHDGVAYCEDHDLGTYHTCLRGVRTSSLERLGRWDESVGIAEALLATVASPVNRMIPMTSLAMVAARRGDPDVWPHLDTAGREPRRARIHSA